MPPRDANIRHMLSELESLGQGLTQWEEDFLQRVSDQFTRTGKLTTDQFSKLTQIYTERVK